MPPRRSVAFPNPHDSGSITPPGYAPAPHLASARMRSQSVSVQRQIDPASIASNIRTQEIAIPGDMVGCIIGKGGSRITEIRRLSGSRISIAKASESEGGERLFTITGTPECNEKALYLLYGQLEAERERRIANAHLMASLESINEHVIAEE
ncbi:RNA binding protein, heterogenous nuclear RNP-K like protein [Linderina macrospora]|uniref:RNA binding protein, heterogenous nuclear RNP-K like protein n=1 Tax=Linderina macrospora TaxID=4868 RepID=A0ACC1JG39_9FUNG|nr:RNA binding protein, heterogenous nuclear RNP-K like protein [Linderina macrospora]